MFKRKLTRGLMLTMLLGMLVLPVAANPSTQNCASASSTTCSG